ncbi:exonuclease subunit SbcD [Dysgonomonas sp. HDW5B]|uniref:exonuclease SbcCD subunit D n=1 Tax=Dysgonomonas sp. HDW5B TaxID=2714927 RepID=UPI0014075B60|nr:exonuclease SbcCD subunit D C-terminal domain-containing protein [Dysgonomonas sp. HDW5B]QIK54462.1 exonuclease subunit SbcD [Dysgonomonas sp. HDW5B]
MILIHTADWHIGQHFFDYERIEEHKIFFNWLKKTIKEQQGDVLLVAGDVFDSPNPSAESQRVYYHFLREVTTENPNLQIIITAGNHDSAARLEAPNPLLEEMNITVRGVVKRDMSGDIDFQNLLVPLKKNGETYAWCIAVPYLRQGDYPNAENYSKGVAMMYDVLYNEVGKIKEPTQAVLAMGHLQATGSEISENDRSERSIIGGLECVSPEVFDKKDLVYTALGHLHKAQRVSGREKVRYAGSPLPMSFAEKNYKQGVNLIELKENRLERLERIEFSSPVQLLSLPKEPKPLTEILTEIAKLPDGEITSTSPFLELKILITEPEPSMRHQIEDALQGKVVRLARLAPFIPKGEREMKTITYEELKTINPLEMAEDVFKNKYGSNMPENMKRLLQSVIQEVEL